MQHWVGTSSWNLKAGPATCRRQFRLDLSRPCGPCDLPPDWYSNTWGLPRALVAKRRDFTEDITYSVTTKEHTYIYIYIYPGQDGGAARRCCDSLRFSSVFCVLQCRPGGLPADEISFQNIKLQTLNPKSWTLKPTSDMTPRASLESKISSKLW